MTRRKNTNFVLFSPNSLGDLLTDQDILLQAVFPMVCIRQVRNILF